MAATSNVGGDVGANMDEYVPTQVRFDNAWGKVKPTVDTLLKYLDGGLTTKNVTKLFTYREQMEAYTITYKLAQDSDNENKDALYKKHGEIIASYLRDRMLPQIVNKHGTILLREFVERWELFKVLNKWMKQFFYYLDNFFVKHNALQGLLNQGFQIFRVEVFDKLKTQLTDEILKVIEFERNGEMLDSNFDTSILQKCMNVYKCMDPKELTVYKADFEDRYIQESVLYYTKQSSNWLATDSTPEYLAKTEKTIDLEAKRVAAYFLPDTDPKIRKECAQTLLKAQETELLEKENSGIRALLRQDKKDDLARVYRMFLQVDDGLPPVALILREHIIQEGKVILDKREAELNETAEGKGENASSDAAFVHALLGLHDKYQKLVQDQFQNHSTFQKELKYAFEATVNTDLGAKNKSTAELLSAHADSVLKSGGEDKLNDSQIEDVLEKVVSLFSFLSDKDVFADVYRNYLAKRLLGQRSASPFAEKSMIQKLKLKCGAHFTSKLEGMLNDFGLGEDLQKKFTDYLSKASEKPPIEFTCDVLTTGHWPTFRAVNPSLPPVMQKCIDVFTTFYSKSTDHRRLNWVHSLGNATVRGNFKISYDFQVSTLQALCLVVFNNLANDRAMSFKEVNSFLGDLDIEVTKRILHSLSCQKVHVLNKEPESKKIEETDVFRVNVDFQSKIRKVRIPMASLEESHNPQRVEEDRGLAIEAAIVRIMKARKRLQHNLLVTEVVNQLRTFRPAPKLIKKKVEHLIEREYLKRDETEQNFYQYLA